MLFAFLYDNHPGPASELMLISAGMLIYAVFPSFFDKTNQQPRSIRLYMALAGLLGLGPALFGKGGAMLYPVLFSAGSVVVFGSFYRLERADFQSERGHSKLGEEIASAAFLIAGPQIFLQILSLHSVATTSVSLFWLWAVPLLLSALVLLWKIAFCLLIQRPIGGHAILGGLLALVLLGQLGRIGAVEHYGVPIPGSFWEAPEYTTEAMAKVSSYGKDGEMGRTFRARIGIKVGSTSESYDDGDGNERTYSSSEGRVLWIEIAGLRRPIVEQDGRLSIKHPSDSVVVHDKLGKSYWIDSDLDFAEARKP